MFNVQLYLEESVLAEIEYQKFVAQSNLKVSGVMSRPWCNQVIFVCIHSRWSTCAVINILSKLKFSGQKTSLSIILSESDVESRAGTCVLSNSSVKSMFSIFSYLAETATNGKLTFNLQQNDSTPKTKSHLHLPRRDRPWASCGSIGQVWDW